MSRSNPSFMLILLISSLLFVAPAAATWVADGSPVCTATGDQYRETAVSDGAGGMIVAWADGRTGEGGGTVLDLYAQRLDADGNALWTTDGILVDEDLNGNFTLRIASDGAGGALIVWDTSSTGGLANVLAQRLDPDGNPLWSAGGVGLASQAWQPTVVSDGAGGAIVAWRDIRPAFGSSSIYAQRIDAAGSQMWTGGSLICVSTGDKGRPEMISDRVGGAAITWMDERELAGGGNERVYAQRVNDLGTVQWTANGIPLTSNSSQQTSPQIVPDGSASGGAIVVWTDDRDVAFQQYAQRVGGSGLLAWGLNGVRLSFSPTSAYGGYVVADGAGGAIASWRTGSFGAYDIHLQRVDSSGSVQWGAGVQACAAAGDQLSRNLLADGAGGVFVGWRDSRDELTTDYDVYIQRFDGAGAAQWLTDGNPLCTNPDYQGSPWLVTDGSGGALAAWYDARNRSGPSTPNFDIYALQIDPDGLIAPGCDVSPAVLDFGTVNAGDHADLGFVITNTGAGDLPGDVTEGCPHFSVVAGAGAYVLSSGQSLAVTVRYEPTATGTHECTIATGLSVCGDVACTGTAVVGAAQAQLSSPPSMIARANYESPPAYGSIHIVGTTENPGENSVITAEFGYGPDGTDPASAGGWQWVAASFHQDAGDADEYVATVTPTVEGTYDYCYRFTYYGEPWLYGDLDGSDNGYTPAQAGDMTVVDLCTSLGPRVYVDADATGTGYGTSWPDAVNELTEALELADLCPAVNEIWVGEGTYRPTGGSDRTARFDLREGLAIYGGFAGTETLRSQRNWQHNETILSGNIGGATIYDNSYCVVAASLVTASTVLDGFTIEGAHYWESPSPTGCSGILLGVEGSPTLSNLFITNNTCEIGAGMAMRSSSHPTLKNLVFADNQAVDGGAMFVGKSCSPTLTNGIFRDNQASQNGGAVYAGGLAPNPDFVNVAFYNNSAGDDGGAIYYDTFSLAFSSLVNASFSENSAGGRGGAIYITGLSGGELTLHNSVLWDNSSTTGHDELHNDSGTALTPTYCLIAGCGGSGSGWNPTFGTDGGGNLDEDPFFKGAIPGIEHPLFFWSHSPLINAGNSALVPAGVTTDVRGEARIAGGGPVDIGAYEHQGGPTGVGDADPMLPSRVLVYQNAPNPFNPQTTIRFDLPRAATVGLRIYDLSGRLVRTLLGGETVGAGRQEVVWNGRDDAGRQLASGTYFYRLEADGYSGTKRMVLVK